MMIPQLPCLALLALLGCERSFEIEKAGKVHTFSISAPYEEGVPYLVTLYASGNLDGEAKIYVIPSERLKRPHERSNFQYFKLPKGRFSKRFFFEPGITKLSFIYEPVTATKGKVKLRIAY